MSRLQTIIAWVKANLLWVISGVFVLVLGGFWWWRQRVTAKPPPSPTPTPVFGPLLRPQLPSTVPAGEEIAFVLSKELEEVIAGFPRTLPVYPVATPSSEISEGSRLAKVFALSETPFTVDEFFVWSGGGGILRYSKTGKTFVYSKFPFVAPPGNLSEATLLEKARGLAGATFSTSGWRFAAGKLSGYQKIEGMEIGEVASFEEADLVSFSFSLTLGNFPLLSSGASESPLVLDLAKDGSLVGFSLALFPSLKEEEGNYPLRSASQVTAALKRKEGVLVKVSSRDYSFGEAGKVISFAPSSVVLAYFPTEDYFQPVYLFEGVAGLSDGSRAPAAVVLPAIPEEWLK